MVSSFLSNMRMNPETSSIQILARQQRLRGMLESRRIPCLLVTHLVNIRYLTGFAGSAAVALFGPHEGCLWVDPRYTLEAREQAQGVKVIEERKGLLEAVAAWLRKKGIREVAYEPENLSCSQFQRLRQKAGHKIRLKPQSNLIEGFRIVKDLGEIESIRSAGRITAEVFLDILPLIKPGLRECDLAAEIEYRLRRRGAASAAFETIVASGPRSAHPHARASSKPLEESEWVILDFGAIVNGYAADMTRTLYLGRPTRRVRGLYSAVANAQQTAVRSVQNGTKASEVDAVARRVLRERGLSRYFTHSTGHGVGLEIHEKPRIAKYEQVRLQAGSVITVEPGVYLEGVGGVRVEDTVVVGPEDPEVLTPATTEQWVID